MEVCLKSRSKAMTALGNMKPPSFSHARRARKTESEARGSDRLLLEPDLFPFDVERFFLIRSQLLDGVSHFAKQP